MILSDEDQDGVMDRRKVFLDSLILPRAICHIGGGLLYAEPPNLWWVPIQDDQPGPRTLVDSAYAVKGNVEHYANGLMRGLDNWVYSARSVTRYRLKHGKWISEKTRFRGQWGITQDAYGRLYYNDNSNQLFGDWVLPNTWPQDSKSAYGTLVQTVEDQRVYPLRPTLVNRGYRAGVLDSTGKLRRFTAACGPVIYLGDQFPESFHGNAFVAAPEANLIKRNILADSAGEVRGRQAYADREFLATAEEVFRPVNLYNGPDGTLYVVDFHRGVVQHKTYVSEYLRENILKRGLDTLVGKGRIYRIYASGKPRLPALNLAEKSGKELVGLLAHPRGWVRQKAQQMLVDRQAIGLVPRLVRMAGNPASPLGQLHALWTLEGLDALSLTALASAMGSPDPKVVATVARLSQELSHPEAFALLDQLKEVADPEVMRQVEISLYAFRKKWGPTQQQLAKRFESGNNPEKFAASIREAFQSTPSRSREMAVLPPVQIPESLFKEGSSLYTDLCSGCHGWTGKGIGFLAPPLDSSEYVTGPVNRLVMIALHGMTGPVTVKGREYRPPEVSPVMPGLKDNPDISDEQIAAILSYIRNAWGNRESGVTPQTVASIRANTQDRKELCTENEFR